MSLAKIEQTDEMKFTFEVDVSGTKDDVSEYRLVIEDEYFSILSKGKRTNAGVEFTLPKLKGILREGVYTITLEVIVGDKIFKPLTDEVVEILPNVEQKNIEEKEPDEKIHIKIGSATATSLIQEAKD